MDQFSFSGKTVLIRVDFNVPQHKDGTVRDATRIEGAIPTIRKASEGGAKVVLMSHLGRPKADNHDQLSLAPIAKKLQELMPETKIDFCKEAVGDAAQSKVKELKEGEVLLLENLRFYDGEEAGDAQFAKQLAALGDIYINDAFGTAHRKHASTAIIAENFSKSEKGFGLLMDNEIKNADRALHKAEHPHVAIIGGAKVSDKVKVIKNLMKSADHILVGGAMAYTFIKANGGDTGKSLVEEDKFDLAKELLDQAKKKDVQIHLPIDSKAAEAFSADADYHNVNSNSIPADRMGLDIGEEASKNYSDIIKEAKTIIWNGPMGVFEFEKYSGGTRAVADAVAYATENNGAFTLIGGGDSVAAINQFGYSDKVSFISTGGGAMLEYLEGKELPGITAINN